MTRGMAMSLMGLWLSGCVAAAPMRHVAGLPETMCKHCNCLMPAGTDPASTCTACNCGKRTHQCLRGR